MSIFIKCAAVIKSCETMEQWDVGVNFMYLTFKYSEITPDIREVLRRYASTRLEQIIEAPLFNVDSFLEEWHRDNVEDQASR